jgi:hypothetical protein
MLPPKELQLTNNFIQNIFLAAKYLKNDNGLKSFYKGLAPNVIKTGFSSAIYFSTLRFCETLNKKYDLVAKNTMLLSFATSSIARVASAVAANPLSVVETRF